MGIRWAPTSLTDARSTIVTAVSMALLLALVAAAAGCTSTTRAADAETAAGASEAPYATSTTAAPATTPTIPAPSSTTAASETTTSSTGSTSTAVPPPPAPPLAWTNAVFDGLAQDNAVVSMTVVRDGHPLLQRASGTAIDGSPATTASPMVVASVSKLLTATAIARLSTEGLLSIDQPVPWNSLAVTPDPGWTDVTVRDLLDHTSGMPVVRRSWFTGEGDCSSYLPMLLASPPARHRGEWTYSNGNYCALGLLISAITGADLDHAVQRLLFDPLGVTGLHLTSRGQAPTDIAYPLGVERLSRLGGAGGFIVSTDAIAALLAAVTPSDRAALIWPAVMFDQYGWGHTGTVDGAKSCAWVVESGRTVIVTTVSGDTPSTGGAVCDRTVPAIAADLGLGSGLPQRTPS